MRKAERRSEHRDGCGGSVPVCGGEREEGSVGEAGKGDDLVLVERRWHVEVDKEHRHLEISDVCRGHTEKVGHSDPQESCFQGHHLSLRVNICACAMLGRGYFEVRT